MGVFFGTDGIRGVVNHDLSYEVCYRCGNALAKKYSGAKLLLGKDTRRSGDFVALAFALGAINGGASVVDVGVCPTAGVAFLTKHLGYDFGVVISASHNPAEFNGIKIFDSFGKKLGDSREEELEKLFLTSSAQSVDLIGCYSQNFRIKKHYESFLKNSIDSKLCGLTIVLDCANGASFKIAPAVFRACGAKVISLSCKPDGKNINKNCGALHLQHLKRNVLKFKADMGFAFDGDSDRVIAVDECGQVVDGDKIIYLFALDYMQKNKLDPAVVVGTRHTNMGVEHALNNHGIKLIRTDIGDKYVGAKLDEKSLLIGGEQSGHVFVKDKLSTGDGILNALLIAEICMTQNKKLSQFFDFQTYKQVNLNVKVTDKMRVINSQKLADAEKQEIGWLKSDGRIMIRVSGTEPYIRIMVETKDETCSAEIAKRLECVIQTIERENC